MITYPKSVAIKEDGPREGFQSISQIIPTEKKLDLIRALVDAGLRQIEVTSFVRPDRVPQLADAEELCRQLPPSNSCKFYGLYLNQKGFERSASSPALTTSGRIMIAASDSFLRSNNNQSIDQALAGISSWCDLFRNNSQPLEQVLVSTAFGDATEGRKTSGQTLAVTTEALMRCSDHGMTPQEVVFADTTGWGNPESVRRLISEFRVSFPTIAVGLHLHDTRGTGMANALSGLQCGVTRFDSSIGGMGGCPFAPGAAGNIATEDFAFLCAELGIATGLDLERLIEAAKLAERIVGLPLPGKAKIGGLLSRLSKDGGVK